MATSYTSLLGLALPVTGELSGTWGDTVNNSITSLVDTAVAGTTTLSSDADVTLTTTSGASNQARQAIIVCSGARTALRTITAPAQSKVYVVVNNTTGGYGVKIVGAGPTTGVTVANGKTTVIAWNGSDFVEITPATAALATAATNIAGGSAGSLPYQSGASTTTFLGIGTSNYVLTSTGSAPQWTASTGTGDIVRATSPALVTPTLGAASATSVALGLGAVGTPSLTFTGDLNTGIWSPTADTIAASTAGAERIRINSIGNVGIGTNSITSIGSNITTTQVVGTVGAGVTLGSASYPTSTTLFTSGDGASATLGTYIAMPLLFATNSLERMRIDSSGNVGIGTATPGSTLDVNGAIAGTSFNKVTITAPASGSTLTIENGKTLTASNTLTLTGTDGSSVAFGAGGTVAYTGGTLAQFASTTSAQLAGVISDETGSGSLVFATSPTLVTPLLGTPTSGTLTNCIGLPISTGISGLGTGVATALAVNTGTAGAIVVNGGALGTPSSGTLTSCTGLPISTGVSGLGTNVATFLATPSSANLAAAVTDETGSGSLVFGTSPTIATPTITTSATVPLVIGGTGTTSTLSLRATSGVGTTGSDIIFQVGNNGATEGMRIVDVGNVGIGTATPTINTTGRVLHIHSSTASTGAITHYTNGTTGTTATDGMIVGQWSDGNALVYSYEPNSLIFGTNTLERMRIDSSGNVGIGTGSPNTTLDVFGSSRVASSSSTAFFVDTSGASAQSSIAFQKNSLTLWQIGKQVDDSLFMYDGANTRDFLQVASGNVRLVPGGGNVGIGTTSPDALLTVNTIASFGDGAVGTPSIAHKGDLNTGFWFPAADTIAASTAGAERIRVDSSGNVMIATTTAAGRLNVYRASSGLQTTTPQLTVQNNAVDGSTSDGPGINFANATGAVANIGSSGNGIMWFSNRADTSASWSTRATIRSTGELWVGRTTALSVSGVTADHAFKATTGDGKWVVGIENAGGVTPWGLGISYSGSAPNNTTQDFIWCVDTGGQRFSVRSNGGIANYQANDVNLSDIRTKTDIQPAESYLDKICAIPVKTFLYKDQTDEQRNLGVIAQDVEAVAPELVDVSGFGEVLEGEEPLKAVYQTDLQYALMKCIQEQQEIIKSLQKRVEDLESAKQ